VNRTYSNLLIELAHGQAKLLSHKTKEAWLSGYRNLGHHLNDPQTGDSLYGLLLEVNWRAEACVKNPRLSGEQYTQAAHKWKALPSTERAHGPSPKRVKELASGSQHSAPRPANDTAHIKTKPSPKKEVS
jgi:hypothetical protein